MAITHSGVAGVCVASHVMGEISAANVHAPTPRLQTEDETAGDLDEQKNGKDATHTSAQVVILLLLFFSISRGL